MPKKYDEETKAKAVRLVVEHAGDYASENEALKTVAGRLGHTKAEVPDSRVVLGWPQAVPTTRAASRHFGVRPRITGWPGSPSDSRSRS